MSDEKLTVSGSWPVDESAFTIPDETFANAITPAITPAITTVVGEVGFHIDPQTRNALRQAFTAGVEFNGRGGPPYAPDFDTWLEQYIEDHERITSE